MRTKFSQFIFVICISLFSGWLIPVQAGSTVAAVKNLRASKDAEKTRIVLDLSAPVTYQFLMLTNPNRLAVDLTPAQLKQKLSASALRKTIVSNIQTSPHAKNRLRIVLSLRQPVTPKVFILSPSAKQSYRLVIDLHNAPIKTAAAMVSPKSATKNAKPAAVQAALPVPAAATPVITAKAHSPARDIVVVIDPGHGGKDPGASGPNGAHEKMVVLAIAKDLQRVLNQEPGFHAVLTRNSDYFIPLRQRLDIARRYKADMFVAIHADAFRNPYASGASVYALSERGATSEAARWLAEKENYSEFVGGGELPDRDNLLRSVLIDLSQNHTIGVSLQMGSMILGQLSKITQLHYTRVEQAAFVVLKSPDIPSLLVETGFLSNPHQEQQLTNSMYQQQIAYAIGQGIKGYFINNSPRGTLVATKREVTTQYKVVRGDTLPAIAKRFKVNVADLRRLNRLKTDQLFIGQVLQVSSKPHYMASSYPSLADIQ